MRRTAEIFLFDVGDYESMFAKYGINGIWDVEQHEKVVAAVEAQGLNDLANKLATIPTHDPNARPLHHRRMSNNSVAFNSKPTPSKLNLIFEMMKEGGEPGFTNMEEANNRRPNAEGLNPCVEIILDSYGVCNLTTVNLVQYVSNGVMDVRGLIGAQERSARAGLRMTLVDLELPHWDRIQKRDRLLGTSLTGVKDAMAMAGYDERDEAELIEVLGDVAREEADRYAKELRVNAPLLVTAVKPEGTISQVANGVSSGLHHAHSPYYIRRVRITSNDPLAKAVQDLGWSVHAEVGTPGESHEERMQNARTLVIDFPVKSGAEKTKDDVYVDEQFDTYFRFQRNYTEHNSSNTIHVRPDEWGQAEKRVYDGWEDFVGVSFLAYNGGSYELAPYEAITEGEYVRMEGKMADFNPDVLDKYETGEGSDLEGADGCEGGVCPIR